MNIYKTIPDLQPMVGEVVGVSEWALIEQSRINQFADATGDHQWIHVDAERAKTGPFGTTIAHGFLTLSLLPTFLATAFKVDGSSAGVNYGLDKVRFTAPVPVGSSLRGSFKLLAWDAINGGGAQMKFELTVECDKSTKPACIAESIIRFFP